MLTKNQIKFIKSLHQKKFRKEEGVFIAEGNKLVNDLLQSNLVSVKDVYATQDWNVSINKGAYKLTIINAKELEQISGLETPNQVLAICEIPLHNIEEALSAKELILALDDVRDPGNLGTIIRIADWFGITYIVCSENTVEAYNPKVIQATMGSISRVKLFYCDLKPFIEEKKKKGVAIYAAMLDGQNLHAEKLEQDAVLLMGNEGKGVSNELLSIVNKPLTIPAVPHSTPYKTQAESLNVAVATAILCAAFRRL